MSTFQFGLRNGALAPLWGLLMLLVATCAFAQAPNYPTQPIRIVVAGAAGGNNDGLARLLAQKLSERLGQSVVVDNRGGAGGTIAAALVAKSPADGYTLLLGDNGTHAVAPTLYGSRLQYDVFKDFTPITLAATFPLVVLSSKGLPIKTPKQLMDAIRAQPGKINYSSGGTGNGSHLIMEMLAVEAGGAKMVHVPYKGGAPAIQALLAGDVQLNAPSVATAMPFIASGSVYPIAVASKKRSSALPDVPTFLEFSINVEADNWIAIYGPPGLPPQIVEVLQRNIREALFLRETQDRLASLGLVPVGSTSAELNAFMIDEVKKWGAAVKQAGATAD